MELPPNILYNITQKERTMPKSSKTKSNNKNSLVIYRRILRLDELFSAETYPSLQDLLEDEEVGASRTTIFRTIEFMKDQLHAPIVFDKANGGYCYSEKAFRLPSVFTTEQELLPFLNMVLSYGKYAVPLEPKELVDMWKDNIKASFECMSL